MKKINLILTLFLFIVSASLLFKIITSQKSKSTLNKKDSIPEYLLSDFWLDMNPERLKKYIKSVDNVNTLHPKTKENMLHVFLVSQAYNPDIRPFSEMNIHPEIISILIEAGLDYSHKTQDRNPEYTISAKPLSYSVISFSSRYVQELLKYDKNVDEPALLDGIEQTPLYTAVIVRAPLETIKALLDAGANPNFQNKETGLSILMASAISDPINEFDFIDTRIIQLLIDYGANIKLKDNKGKMAIDYMREDKKFRQTLVFKQLSKQYE